MVNIYMLASWCEPVGQVCHSS